MIEILLISMQLGSLPQDSGISITLTESRTGKLSEIAIFPFCCKQGEWLAAYLFP
jgi:hypothetical protein